MYLLREEHDRRRAAYLVSRSDRAAAELLGMSRGTFVAWRRAVGLPAKASSSQCTPDENERRLAIYNSSRNDEEAAAVLGITRETFGQWRRRQGVPSKNAARVLSDKELYLAWVGAGSDSEIMETLGSSVKPVRRWRRRNGVPAKRGNPARPRRIGRSPAYLRRWAAYCNACSAADAAVAAGVTESSMLRWLRRHQLPTFNQFAAARKAIVGAARRGDAIAKEACIRRRWLKEES